jgi:predicted metal-dependent enzyme (double-stranded beta helix superfamily)
MSEPLNVEGERAAAIASDDLTTFVADIEALLAHERHPHRIAAGVQARLPRLLASSRFLGPEQREPWPDRYRPQLLTVAPSGRFSVVSLVWLPGQTTPIHDHICWCVVGVLEGLERERRYTLREDASGARWLAPLAEEAVTPGHTCALVPPDENIHQVRNAGDGLAISIHVYGEDLTAHPTSINQCFDELPIRLGDLSGSPVAWRRVAGV